MPDDFVTKVPFTSYQSALQHLYFLHKYTSITPPANSKANRGRWCEDGPLLRLQNWCPKMLLKCPVLVTKVSFPLALLLFLSSAKLSLPEPIGVKRARFRKIGERFQRKLKNLRNYCVFKDFRLLTLLNHAELNKRSKQFENHRC